MEKKVLAVTALIMGLLPAATGGAAGLSIRAEVERDRIEIAEPLKFTLTITAEEGVDFVMPDERIPLSPFEVIGYRIGEDREGVKRIEYLITTYEVGEFEIPSLILPYRNRDGGMEEARTEPIRVVVEGVAPPEEEDLKGIKGPLKVDGVDRPSGLWPLALLPAGIILLLTILVLWRREGRKEGGGMALSPAEKALKELERIEGMGLIERGEMKRYHRLIAELLREYVGERFSIDAGKMTTGELVGEVEGRIRGDGRMEPLWEVLMDCDLVKFSRYRPDPQEARGLAERTREVILQLSSTGSV